MDETCLRQNAEYGVKVVRAEDLRAAKRQLERRTFDVIDEDVQVVRIDERMFRRTLEEIRRVAHDELIERSAARYQHRGRLPRATARASSPLPRCSDGSRIAGHDGHVQGADIDAELERVGRNHCPDTAFAQSPLDLASPQRQVPATVTADAPGGAGQVLEIVLEIGGEN